MPLPFSTSTITIVRSLFPTTEDPYDPPSSYPNPSTFVVAVGVPAVVGVPTINPTLTIGERVVYTSRLNCEPCDLQEGDFVTESYGRIFVALGPTPFGAFFISGMQATLRLVQSFAQ